jgi:hypothetical protein
MTSPAVSASLRPWDVAVMRRLVRQRRANGWEHIIAGWVHGDCEHLYRLPGGRRVVVWRDQMWIEAAASARLVVAKVASPDQAAQLLWIYGVTEWS